VSHSPVAGTSSGAPASPAPPTSPRPPYPATSMWHRRGCKESPENYLYGFPSRLPASCVTVL